MSQDSHKSREPATDADPEPPRTGEARTETPAREAASDPSQAGPAEGSAFDAEPTPWPRAPSDAAAGGHRAVARPGRAPLARPLRSKALTRAGPPGDHTALHSTVARAMMGAGAGAVVADALAWALGTGLWDSPLLSVGVLGGALAAVAARGKKWWRAALGGLAGSVGAVLFTLTAPLWPPFAALLMGLAAAPVLAEGQSKGRKAVTAALAGVAGAAGLYVARVMLGWDVFDGVVPSLLGHAGAGAAAGLFVGLASAPRYLGQPPDPVESAYHPALAVKDGEVHQILARTIEIHRALQADLAARAGASAVERVGAREDELVLRILHIAKECRKIRADLDATPAAEIEARIAELSRRAEATPDEGARATYAQTVASLEEQLEALARIENGRERVVARLHATVALLEKLRFALIHMRSADAERVGGELPVVTEALDALTDELEATSSAVGEVYGGTQRALHAGEGAEVLPLRGVDPGEHA